MDELSVAETLGSSSTIATAEEGDMAKGSTKGDPEVATGILNRHHAMVEVCILCGRTYTV